MFIRLDEDNYVAGTLLLASGDYPEDFFEAGELPEPIEEYKYIDGVFIHAPRDPDPPTQEDINATNLEYLVETDWKMQRHSDELLSGVTPSLSPTELAELLSSRQEAREAIV